jgi:hypothetical protein
MSHPDPSEVYGWEANLNYGGDRNGCFELEEREKLPTKDFGLTERPDVQGEETVRELPDARRGARKERESMAS